MRLLNVASKKLCWFEEHERPNYAILSHTWGATANEVTFQEIEILSHTTSGRSRATITSKPGFKKIEECCRIAQKDGFRWVWIDTCGIDKTSSAELSEAVNSMYRWYQRSKMCYVYLSDVSALDHPTGPNSEFRQSRWFRRGWTLQELIAPRALHFYSKDWILIGPCSELTHVIEEVTRIPISVFADRNLMDFSLAQRMAWAANRTTTRTEDTAYCLLGIFDVNMPLLYGEGSKAFRRLQETIVQQSPDQSIFAWGRSPADLDDSRPIQSIWGSFLADHPSDFAQCHNIVPCAAYAPKEIEEFEVTKMGIRIELPVLQVLSHETLESDTLAVLNCRPADTFGDLVAIHVWRSDVMENGDFRLSRRMHPSTTTLIRANLGPYFRIRRCYLKTFNYENMATRISGTLRNTTQVVPTQGFSLRLLTRSSSLMVVNNETYTTLYNGIVSLKHQATFVCMGHNSQGQLHVELTPLSTWAILSTKLLYSTPPRYKVRGWTEGFSEAENVTVTVQHGGHIGIAGTMVTVGNSVPASHQPLRTWTPPPLNIFVPMIISVCQALVASTWLKESRIGPAVVAILIASTSFTFVVMGVQKFTQPYNGKRRTQLAFLVPFIGLIWMWISVLVFFSESLGDSMFSNEWVLAALSLGAVMLLGAPFVFATLVGTPVSLLEKSSWSR